MPNKYDINVQRRGFAKGGSGPSNQPSPRQIEAFVAKHFEFKPRKNGTELRICNPFEDDDGYHFNISIEKGVCHCWTGDDWAGPPSPRTNKRNVSFVRFVQKYLNCSYHQAVRAIGEASSDPFLAFGEYNRPQSRQDDIEDKEKPLVALPDGSEPLATTEQKKLGGILRHWLAGRGIIPADVQKFNIHHLAASVIWPYYEFEQLVYWQLRNRLNKQFLFPDEQQFGVTKGQFLYGFDEVEPASELVITESIFGQFTLKHQCVATGGADITVDQIKKINLLGPRDGIVLAPDNDVAGLKSIVNNGKKLQQRGYDVYCSVPPRLEYDDHESGEKKVSKDWNELFVHIKMPLIDVRKAMERNIRKLDLLAQVQLMQQINDLEKRKKSIGM